MRSIQMVAARVLEEREMPMPPDPGPGEALVRVRAVGICGSDMHWYLDGRIGSFQAAYPQILGHEPAGEIVGLGAGVTDRAVGQMVSIEPSITCGHCEHCLRGFHNNCLQSVFMGSPVHYGLFREYAIVPARNCDVVPPGFDWVKATLIEPVAVMVHILELVKIRLGDTVAVLGAGPIGMLCANIAKMSGASTVYIGDKLPHRLALAREMGADVAVDMRSESFVETVFDGTKGRGVDVVLDAAGAVETMNLGIAVARVGGAMAFIGIPSERQVVLDVHTAMAKELKLQTIKRSNHKGHEAIALLQSGRISEKMITHRLPFERTPWGFETLAQYSDNVGKVVIELD